MLELKLPAGKSASRHTVRTPQGRSLRPDNRASLPLNDHAPSRRVEEQSRLDYAAREAEARSSRLLHERRPVARTFNSSAAPRVRTVPAIGTSGTVRRTGTLKSHSVRIVRPSLGDTLAKSEARLVTLAVSCTAVCCVMLVVYLGAYARVASLSIQQAQASKAFRAARQQNELLRAQLAAARSPQHIVAAAAAQGMVPSTGRACYITVPGDGASTTMRANYQVASHGTKYSDFAADLGH